MHKRYHQKCSFQYKYEFVDESNLAGKLFAKVGTINIEYALHSDNREILTVYNIGFKWNTIRHICIKRDKGCGIRIVIKSIVSPRIRFKVVQAKMPETAVCLFGSIFFLIKKINTVTNKISVQISEKERIQSCGI